ncbi:hypothetical protein BU25DRAFT_464915 [Macroventuria anomochaeta]|uniref:Uncharacterized protein n=1 Tax=Macroventuria anomochaeta TaxID=301207 RepID=A0ACB6SHP4_9PLEO|nr:uncharacterized protein BU25DRAFT_464915 [Macroventuria anomochaeta]KAF2633701.1 hypothetical protein BU25DRAFT_464915 [Macroventuria anomochaeta]
MATKSTSTSPGASVLPPQDFLLLVKWQKEHAPGSDIGQVCDALEYYRFIKHRDALIGGNIPPPVPYRSHTASECGHAYHPSDISMNELCPVCEVAAHLSFLQAITVAWNKVGGPRLLPGIYVTKKSGVSLRAGWHMARLQLQELLDMFDILVMYEEDWEAKHPFEAAAARRTNCASAAIKLAQEESTYPAHLSPPTTNTNKTKPIRAKKTVTFAAEVHTKDDGYISRSATRFTHDRPRNVYCRSSLTYEPGEHVCPANSEYIDTSQASLVCANISNLKIYITDDEGAFDGLQANPQFYGEFVGDHQGIVGLHERVDDISRLMHTFLTQDEHRGSIWR